MSEVEVLARPVSTDSTKNYGVKVCNTDALGMGLMQDKIATTQGLLQDAMATMKNNLNSVGLMRELIGKIRAADPSIFTEEGLAKSENAAVKKALDALKSYEVALPTWKNSLEDAKRCQEILLQNADSRILQANSTNQNDMIKLQQLNSELHLCQQTLSAMISKLDAILQAIAKAIGNR